MRVAATRRLGRPALGRAFCRRSARRGPARASTRAARHPCWEGAGATCGARAPGPPVWPVKKPRASLRTGHGKGPQQSVPQPPPPAQDRPRAPRMPGRRQGQQQGGEPRGGAGRVIMAPKRRRDSPAIDGMRIRHNARPRTGQGASRRAPRRGWRSRATTSGSRFSKTRQKPARKAGRKERGEATTKDGETRTGGKKVKKSKRAGHVKYPEPIGMCPLCGPWPGRMQGPIRGGGGRPSSPPPPCGRMSGRHAQGPELVKAGRAERAAGAEQGTWDGRVG